jgi:broad specificity phosphatase PhoE
MTQVLLLVRHGEAEGGKPGVLLGRTDAGLSAVGREQSALLRDVLPLTDSARLVSSPLARARQTAAIAAAVTAAAITAAGTAAAGTAAAGTAAAAGISVAGSKAAGITSADFAETVVEIEPDLREIDFGDWEGRKFEEIEREYPSLVQAWSEFDLDFGFPGGERLQDLAARIEQVAGRLAALDVDTVVAFTHGGVIRALICHFLGLPLRDYLLFDITPASVTTLRIWGERGILAGLRPGENLSGEPSGWIWRRSSS